MVKLISACQNDALDRLMKLQLRGITDDQILNCCRVIEANHNNLKPHFNFDLNNQLPGDV
jgi:hypothetical protein